MSTSDRISFGIIKRSLCPHLYRQIDGYARKEAMEEDEEEGGKGSGGQGAIKYDTRSQPAASTSRKPLPANLSRLPNELLEEICTYAFHPGDLLSLSLTCRTLYRLLRPTSRTLSIEIIWAEALRRSKPGGRRLRSVEDSFEEEMQRCGMRVGEYAVLVYGSCCQVCGKNSEEDTIVFFHQLRLKCCASCARRTLFTQAEISHNFPSLQPEAFLCSRSTEYDPLTFSLQAHLDWHRRHPNSTTDAPSPSASPPPADQYFLPEVLAHSATLEALEGEEEREVYVEMRQKRKKRERRLMEDLLEKVKGR